MSEVIEHIDADIPYLKPCRCCGQENPRMLFGKKVGTDVNVYRIMCDNCGNNGEMHLNEQQCIQQWNRRTLHQNALNAEIGEPLTEHQAQWLIEHISCHPAEVGDRANMRYMTTIEHTINSAVDKGLYDTHPPADSSLSTA